MNIQVTRIHKLEGDGKVKGFVDIVFGDCLSVKGLRLVEGKNGLFISMPREQGKDRRWYEIIKPMTKEFANQISKTILEVYNFENKEL